MDRNSPLMLAARPVLDDLADQLDGTRFSVLLADRESRIVDRRYGHLQLARALDAVLAVPGHRYLEETTGTNALATAFEVRHGFVVTGEEHYLESLKSFACYGHPIVHPVTRRLEGVLDVTGYAADATPMLGPFVTWAVRAIEQRLELGGSLTQRYMLAAFRERTTHSHQPVLVFGDDLTLANAAATDRFDGAAQLVLREVARDAVDGRTVTAFLPSGDEVHLRCTRVDGAADATMIEVVPTGAPRPIRVVRRRAGASRTLISGEPGSGRTHAARQQAGTGPVRFVDGSVVTVTDLDEVGRAPQDDLIVVEHIHLVHAAGAVRLSTILDASPARFVLTSGPSAELRGEQLALAARCAERVELPPLRTRRSDIPRLAQAMLAELRPAADVRLTTQALRTLMEWHWPGNLRELRTVLDAAAARRSSGDILRADLPMINRQGGRRSLSPLEQAEVDAIRAALRRAAGNKSRAATDLGIGRTTLYRRLRELGLDG